MNDPTQPLPAAARGTLSPRRWIWVAVVCSVGVCVLVAALHYQQQRQLASASALIARMGRANDDLANGLLHHALAGAPGSPWQREQGLALMSQALLDFEMAATQAGAPWQERQAFAERLGQFRTLLLQAAQPGPRLGADSDLDLRLAYNQLATSARAMDASLRRNVADLSGSLDSLFNTSLAASGLLLLGVCLAVLRSERERSRAEQALRSNEARHRSTVAALSEGVLVFDTQGRMLSCNRSAEQLLGSSEAQLTEKAPGQLWSRMTTADGKTLAEAEFPLALTLATGRPRHNQVLGLLRSDGGPTWLNVNAEPLLALEDGRLIGAVASLTDITERRRDRQELLRNRSQLTELVEERTRDLRQAVAERLKTETFAQTLVDNLPGLVAYVGRDLRLQFANRSLEEWFERRPGEQAVQTLSELLGPELMREHEAALGLALNGQRQEFQARVSKPDGSTGHLLGHLVPDRHQNLVRGVFLIASDVTSMKLTEQRLQQLNQALGLERDRAAAAASAKSSFLANMSHEIRTPMNAIIGLTHLLRRDIQQPDSRERLNKVGDAATHLLDIINNVLDLSKIEAGKLALEQVDFGLDEMLARTLSLVAEPARSKGLALVQDTDGLPRRLHGDPVRLSQALLNLLSNAVKFTERGTVTLRGEVMHADQSGLMVHFEVRDSGIGISAEQAVRLFDAFEQADSSTTRRHGGTGLGLAITRHLAQMMGGQAGAAGELGVGSRFWFTAQLQHAKAPLPVASPSVLTGRRTLVVDDLPEARQALADMASSLGLRVDSMPSGAQALQAAVAAQRAGDPYQLALLDWLMPEQDGLATALALCHDAGVAAEGILLVSAWGDAKLRAQARDAGLAAVLDKPVTASTLHDRVLQACLALDQRLPARSAGASASAPTAGWAGWQPPASLAGLRVLLAEDNPVNQEVATELLRLAGMNVDVAGDGEQAVRMACDRRYDLVLMDVQMPVMDGLQATRRLRELGQTLPILAMTANAFNDDRTACLAAGMNDHVAKPVEPDRLLQTVAYWLGQRPGGTSAHLH